MEKMKKLKPWLFIFIIKLFEVSFETMRIALIVNGSMVYSSGVEGIARALQVTGLVYVFKNLNKPSVYVAFACGHMFGNFLGLVVLKGTSNIIW
jgi:uncharacterized protein YebE (UPF0316 family)